MNLMKNLMIAHTIFRNEYVNRPKLTEQKKWVGTISLNYQLIKLSIFVFNDQWFPYNCAVFFLKQEVRFFCNKLFCQIMLETKRLFG